MFTHSHIAKFWLIVLCFAATLALGQSAQITGRSTPNLDFHLRLDQSFEVTFNLSSSGLNSVVPVLVATNAAQAAVVSTTWTGSSAVSNPSAVTFLIHLYDEPTLCGDSFNFNLQFRSDTNPTVTANPINPNDLSFDTSASGVVVLEKRLAGLSEPLPTTSGGIKSFPVVSSPHTQSDIDNSRIYWYADWNLNGYHETSGLFSFSTAFQFFFWSLSGTCYLNVGTDIITHPTSNISGEVIDVTSGTPVTIELEPFGGGGIGEFPTVGVNVFDITDLSLGSCSGSVKDNIHYLSPGGPLELTYFLSGNLGIYLRNFRIYAGSEAGCTASGLGFGDPPSFSQFHFENFTMSSEGDVSASLVVPPAWRSSADVLASGYTVQFYLRTDGSYLALGASGNSLNLATKIPGNITNPEDYFLEARVRRTTTETNTVSTTSSTYRHGLSYSLVSGSINFEGEESSSVMSNNDHVLDPGEIVNMPYRVTAESGSLPSNIIYTSGVHVDSNFSGHIDTSDLVLTSNTQQSQGGVNFYIDDVFVPGGGGSSQDVVASFELFTAPGPIPPAVWFFIKAEYTEPQSGSTTSYLQYFRLKEIYNSARDLNAENTSLSYSFDFAAGSQVDEGWDFENENPTSPTRGGWAWNTPSGPWAGNGGTARQNATDKYSLLSPVFDLGDSTEFRFNHLPYFHFNQSGGMLEYRARTPTGSFGAWTNYIDENGPSGIYNTQPFPTTPSSYLGGKGVWMSDETSARTVTLNVPSSLVNTYDHGFIQFRFIFLDPSLVDELRSTLPTRWDINWFEFETEKLLLDNIFRVDLDTLDMDACNPVMELLLDRPVPIGNLDFRWYESLSDLFNDDFTATGNDPTVPFDTPLIMNPYNFYVRILYLGTERVLPVTVTRVSSECPEFCLTQEQINQLILEEAGGWPQLNIIHYVEDVNRLCGLPEERRN